MLREILLRFESSMIQLMENRVLGSAIVRVRCNIRYII